MTDLINLKKNMVAIDIWTFASMFFLATPGYFMWFWLFIKNTEKFKEGSLDIPVLRYVLLFASLLIIIFILFCSRLRKWRYLIIYPSCQKLPEIYKVIMILVVIGMGIYIVATQFFIIMSLIPICLIISATSFYWNEKVIEGLIA